MTDPIRAALAAPTPEPDTNAVLRLAAALAEAILSHPSAREVFAAPTPPADGETEIPGEVHAAFAELERCEENLRNFRQLRADLATTTPTQPADGEAIGPEWRPCVKLPITVHVREQRPGETHVSTREGITPVKVDDLIMRGVQGEEYPIGRELFDKTYRLGPAPASAENTTPPADGEVEELAAWLLTVAASLQEGSFQAPRLRRAAALLREACPQPVPVADRPPGPEDCDAEGRVWVCERNRDMAPQWNLLRSKCASTNYGTTHWLPHWAIPTPTEPTTEADHD